VSLASPTRRRPRGRWMLVIFKSARTARLDVEYGRAASVGGAPMASPRQQKEVIQVAHINVGSVASLGALVWGGVLR
jgi:hypothetical protein